MARGLRFSCLALAFFAISTYAQSVVSARSGTIHYVEGKALLNGQEISPKFGEFPAMDNGSVLQTTEEGRVEILLSPGAILRVGESSSIRMVANALTDTQVELQSGKAVLECAEVMKGNEIALLVNGHAVSAVKDVVVEATTQPAAVRVYKGEATVAADGKAMTIRKGHEAFLGAEITAQKFDDNATDDLYNWSSRRSGYLALANIAAAREAGNGYGGYGGGYAGFGAGYAGFAPGMWAWNPWFGMFTMVPFDGMFYSPFGWGFYSPFEVGGLYSACYFYGCYYPYGGYYGPTGTVGTGNGPVTRPIRGHPGSPIIGATGYPSRGYSGGLLGGGSMRTMGASMSSPESSGGARSAGGSTGSAGGSAGHAGR
jgi:hypothetical protein